MEPYLGLIASYLLGAIPFGWVLVRLLGGQDLRQIGSGNIGATNAGRALGTWAAFVVYLLDFSKGFLPAMYGSSLFLTEGILWPVLFGSAAILGHCFPIYLKFRGGKGVATTTGVMVALDPLAFLFAGLVWLPTFALFRMVSLASVLMGIALPWMVYLQKSYTETRQPVLIFGIVVSLLILFTHRENIKRIFNGTEPRVKLRERKTS